MHFVTVLGDFLLLRRSFVLFYVPVTRYNASSLREIALEFIMRNLCDPKVQSGLKDLRPEPDLLVEIITRSSAHQMQWATSTDSATESEWSGR